MSLPALLLRVLLCVSLVANGVGAAQASALMQWSHAAHAAHAAVEAATPRAARECHPGMTMASHGATPVPAADRAEAADAGAAGDSAASRADGMAADDCCSGATCQCACTQHAPAGFLVELVPGSRLQRPILAVGGGSQRASPRLPHLIRPPIG